MELLKAIPILSHLLLAESRGMTFLEALPILKNGILASGLAALVCSFLGVYIILKRIVFVSAALTQISSLGIALALLITGLLGSGTGMAILPSLSSLLFACLAASLLAIQTGERRITREGLLGIGYILPTGLTLLILDRVTTHPGLIEDILFGNAVFVAPQQLLVLALVSAVIFLIHGLFHKEFVFTSFDPETARASGLPSVLFNQLLFLTLALATSISISSIGALPVFAFTVMPAAAALLLTEHLKRAFALSVGFGLFAALAGFYLSFLFSLPTGPTMLSMAGLFLIPGGIRTLWRH